MLLKRRTVTAFNVVFKALHVEKAEIMPQPLTSMIKKKDIRSDLTRSRMRQPTIMKATVKHIAKSEREMVGGIVHPKN